MAVVLMQPARHRSHVELEVHVDRRVAGELRFEQRLEAAQVAVHCVDAFAGRVPAIALEREHELARAHGRMNRATSQPSSTRPTKPTPMLPSTSDVSQLSHGSGAPDKASSPGAVCGGTSCVMRNPQNRNLRCVRQSISAFYSRQSSPGITRRRNSSNRGTVNAVSPWLGLKIIPFAMS